MHYYAEQSCTAGRTAFITGMQPVRVGMTLPEIPGSPSYLRPGTPASCQVPARSRLQHRRVRQEPPGRPRRLAADRARLPGILGLPLSPRCDAGGELPRHQQDPDPADPRAAMQEHADPRRGRGSRRGGSQDHGLPDAAASDARVHVIRRHWRQTNVQGRGTADPRSIEDRGRGNLGQGRRLPRPQRSRRRPTSRSSSGTTPRACTSRPCCRTSTWPWWASPAARTGASTKPA